MKIKPVSHNARFCCPLFFAVLTGVCRMAHGTSEWRYSSVVTNVPDATHVMVEDRRLDSRRVIGIDHALPLDGIVAPEKGHHEEEALISILRKTLIGKRVNVKELLDKSTPRGASVYVTDDPKRFAQEDNVNIMLVREGFARYSGDWNSHDGTLGGLAEAQKQAQVERKGIWADWQDTNTVQEATPEPAPPPAADDEESVAQVSSGRDGSATCGAGPGTGCARVPLAKTLRYALLAIIPCLLAVLCLVRRNLRKPQ